MIKEYMGEAHNLIEPLYVYIIRDIEQVVGSNIYIEGSIVFNGEVIARLLDRCCKVALFVVTIGKYLEEMANRLAEDGLILQSYVLDAIGSDAVEKLADFVKGILDDKARVEGLVTSRRFSPGYCDWDISQQEMVFTALEGDSIGVQLTEGYLMVPQKSISGIIGISTPDSGAKNYNPCETCRKYDCLGRR
ncbi:MAG TPA: hypothetical protein G4O13_01190 [Dehalococcoidia bacterium]|nr:hypothetical protein [Dehalococcoidia bacterium]